ncbi:MAG: hypothetical protein IRY90_19005 [Actinomadura rubrobrunea]|nr:hypothetical protein [Actinomadura rubrobrunea]
MFAVRRAPRDFTTRLAPHRFTSRRVRRPQAAAPVSAAGRAHACMTRSFAATRTDAAARQGGLQGVPPESRADKTNRPNVMTRAADRRRVMRTRARVRRIADVTPGRTSVPKTSAHVDVRGGTSAVAEAPHIDAWEATPLDAPTAQPDVDTNAQVASGVAQTDAEAVSHLDEQVGTSADAVPDVHIDTHVPAPIDAQTDARLGTDTDTRVRAPTVALTVPEAVTGLDTRARTSACARVDAPLNAHITARVVTLACAP